MHQLVIKRFQHCLMHGVTMKYIEVYLLTIPAGEVLDAIVPNAQDLSSPVVKCAN